MCAKFGCGPTVVSKGGGAVQTDIQTDRHTDRQTDKGILQLYIVDYTSTSHLPLFYTTLYVYAVKHGTTIIIAMVGRRDFAYRACETMGLPALNT